MRLLIFSLITGFLSVQSKAVPGLFLNLNTQQPCIVDYHISAKPVPHRMSAETVATLSRQFNNPMEGWRILGENGDTYAAIAEKVLNPNSGVPFIFYRKLIRNHWQSAVGDAQLNLKFDLVAKKHFSQYVEIIKTGYWPDSDQILNSYLNAIRTYRLPDITVFDAAWDAAGMNWIQTWQALNHLPASRTVFPTRACFKIDPWQARQIVTHDLLSMPPEALKSLFPRLPKF